MDHNLFLLLSDVASMLPVAARLHPDDLEKLQVRVLNAIIALVPSPSERGNTFSVRKQDAEILNAVQNQISDLLAKLYVDTGLLTEEVRLAFGPRPQAWLKVKKL